jgi:nucleoside-diphosphate-sugar epimerase
MRKIIITGGCGYLGSKLIEILGFGDSDDIVVFDSFTYDQYHVPLGFGDNVRVKRLDIFSPESCQEIINEAKQTNGYPCTVCLLHALVGMPVCNVYDSIYGTEFVNRVNFETIDWLVKGLSDLPNPPLIVYPNTNSGYGNTDGVCTEETPLKPLSSYGETKLKAEETIIKNAKNWVIFRLATLFGIAPRMRFDLLVNDLVYRGYFNNEINIFEPDAKRNFIHVQDVAVVFASLLTRDERNSFAHLYTMSPIPTNEVYNLGNDSINCSKLELVTKISMYLGGIPVNISNDKDPDQRNYVVSSQKISPYLFPQHSLEYGMEEITKYLKILPKDPDLRADIAQALGFRNVLVDPGFTGTVI